MTIRKTTLLGVGIMLTNFSAIGQVTNLSPESFAQYGKEDAYWTINVQCKGSDTEHVIQRKTDGDLWCLKSDADVCSDNKQITADKLCSAHVAEQTNTPKEKVKAQTPIIQPSNAEALKEKELKIALDKKQAEERRASEARQLVDKQKQAEIAKRQEEAKKEEAIKTEARKIKAVEPSTAEVTALAPSTQTNIPEPAQAKGSSLQEKLTIDEQLLLIEQEKLELRKKELELERKVVEIKAQLGETS